MGGSNGESPLLKTVITALDLESNDIGRALAYKMRDKVMMFCRIASIIYFLNLVSLQIILVHKFNKDNYVLTAVKAF